MASCKSSFSLLRICPGCKQELCRLAYYRHQSYPDSCPAMRSTYKCEIASVESAGASPSESFLESTAIASASTCDFPNSNESICEEEYDDDSYPISEGSDRNEGD